MFIIDYNSLAHGDIILTSDCTALSKIVRKSIAGDYSHAMIWVGGTLIHSDGGGVYSKSVQRLLFQDKNKVKLLRLKKYITPQDMNKIISFARSQTGKLYSIRDAVNSKFKRNIKASKRQFCSRLVAQAYQSANIKIVDDAEFCNPEEINKSSKLYVVKQDSYLREATSKEIEFSRTTDPNDKIQRDTMDMLEKIRDTYESEIQTITDISSYLESHIEHDDNITSIAVNSGYFDHAEFDMKKNGWRYSDSDFRALVGQDKKRALELAEFIEYIGKDSFIVHKKELEKYEKLHNEFNLKFYKESMWLYKRMVNTHLLRYDVARLIKKSMK